MAAGDGPAEYIDPSPSIASIVGMTPEPGASEIPFAVPARGKFPLWVFPKESPDVEILDSAIPMDEVPGTALAKANQHPSVPVEIACLRTSVEQSLKFTDRDLGQPAHTVSRPPPQCYWPVPGSE